MLLLFCSEFDRFSNLHPQMANWQGGFPGFQNRNDYQEELPEGFSWIKVTKTVWEFRCPRGDECGHGRGIVFKKPTKEAAENAAHFHLYSKECHNDPPYDWETVQLMDIDNPNFGPGTLKHIHMEQDQLGTEYVRNSNTIFKTCAP